MRRITTRLTGLANRRAFMDQLNDALVDPRTGAEPRVLLMDLNGFKEINDRLGHEIGDALLVAFAERLERSLPADTASARLGGDEFAVLVQAGLDPVAAAGWIAAFHNALSAPLDIEGFPLTVGVSIGVATAPEDGRTGADLLRAADVAMYKAKRCRHADRVLRQLRQVTTARPPESVERPQRRARPTTNCTSTSNPSCACPTERSTPWRR